MESANYPTFCPKCKKSYNISIVPFELPCGHSFCEECLMKFHEKKKKFLCFLDDKTFGLNVKDLSIPFFYGRIVKQCYEKPQFYMCSKHINEAIKFRCSDHNELLCCLCMMDHFDHKNSIKIFVESDLIQDIEMIEQKLDQIKEKIDSFKNLIQNIKMKKILSKDIKAFFVNADALINQSFFPNINKQNKKPEETILPPQFKESIILAASPNKDFIISMFNEPILSAKLLFRGSRDGFTSEKFHELCDGKERILVLVKSKRECSWGIQFIFMASR